MGAGALDGVFCLGEDEEVSLKKAEVPKGSADEKVRVLGLLKAADAHVQAGRLAEAAKEVESANRIIQETRFNEGRALAITLVAKIYAKQWKLSTADQLDEAQDLASEAQEKFQKFGAKKCEAAALLALAAARYAVKKFDLGMQAAKDAQLLLEGVGDKAAVAYVYREVADGFVLKEDTKKAGKMMLKARAIYAELSDKKNEAACFHRIGEIEIQGNDKGKALAALSTARKMYRELLLYRGEAAVLGSLRDFHLKKARVAEAVDVCKEIVGVYHDAGDTRGEGNALVSLAELLMEKGQLELSMKVAQAAYKVFSSVRDGEGVVKATELHSKFKNEVLKTQIREAIESNRDFQNYPEYPAIEFGLATTVAEAFNATVQKGL